MVVWDVWLFSTYGEAAAADLLRVSLVEVGQNILERGAVKAVGENGGVADDVVSGNQFFYRSGFHLSLDAVPNPVGFGFQFLHHGFVFVQQFDLGKQFHFRHCSSLL